MQEVSNGRVVRQAEAQQQRVVRQAGAQQQRVVRQAGAQQQRVVRQAGIGVRQVVRQAGGQQQLDRMWDGELGKRETGYRKERAKGRTGDMRVGPILTCI